MKTTTHTFMAAAGLLAVLAFPALGQESYPVLRPKGCNQIIKVPAGSNGQYYLSKDCKTAFILPKEITPMGISDLRTSANVEEFHCDLALEQAKRIPKAHKQMSLLEERLNNLTLRREERLAKTTDPVEEDQISKTYDPKIEAADKAIKEYFKILLDLEKGLPYSILEGAVVNVQMALDQASDVNAFQELNKETGIRFQAARIQSGVLSFAISGEDGKAEGLSILEAKIPGINADVANRFSDSRHLIANGGASGIIMLNQPSVCKMVRRLNKDVFDDTLLTNETMSSAGFTANYIYEVPVSTDITFLFQANSTPKDIRAAFEGKITKGQFTQEDISSVLYSGSLVNDLYVKYGDGGIPTSVIGNLIKDDEMLNSEDEKNVFTNLFDHALEIYLAQMVEKMKTMNLITESVLSDITPVEGKEVIEDRVMKKCRWKTNWGGRPKRKCSNYVVHDRVFHNGVSSANRSSTDNVAFTMKFMVDSEHTLSMKHSTGFGKVK